MNRVEWIGVNRGGVAGISSWCNWKCHLAQKVVFFVRNIQKCPRQVTYRLKLKLGLLVFSMVGEIG